MGASKKRVIFELPENEACALRELSDREGMSITALIRRAIRAEVVLSENYRLGNKILIEDSSKNIRELVRV